MSMNRTFAIGVLFLTATAAAQEGVTTLPKNYTPQFENEWVKVTAVRYGPHEKLPGHTHTPRPAAYVYLNDGGPVIFRHVGGPAATRPATKTGTVRVYRGLDEVHEVENTTATPSEFLRVEFKTAVLDAATFRGKFDRPTAPSLTPVIHLDHPQVRLSRVWVAPGETLRVTGEADPSLLISLSPKTMGRETWISPGADVRLSNPGTAPAEYLRFQLKTAPLTH
jgi:hypothetical protein